jgi:sporulation protein YlmC with PRC-barrel domain
VLDGQNIASYTGAQVLDPDGSKIGTVGQIYVEPQTGRPNWAAVKTGLFGMSESFVPLDEAEDVDGNLRVPFSKEFVKDSPRSTSDGGLSQEAEDRLYAYYRGDDAAGGDDTARDDADPRRDHIELENRGPGDDRL